MVVGKTVKMLKKNCKKVYCGTGFKRFEDSVKRLTFFLGSKMGNQVGYYEQKNKNSPHN